MKKLSILVLTVLILGQNIVFGEKKDLIKKLSNAGHIEQERIVEQIIEQKTEFIPELILALEDENWQVRASVLNMLGNMEVKEAVPKIISVLKDDNKMVKVGAIWALGKIKDESAIPGLKEVMLKDADKDCRMAAAFGLGMLGSKKAIPYLKEALKDEEKTVQVRAAGSLGRLGDDSGYNIAIDEVTNSNIEVRRYAVEAIGLVGRKEGVNILNNALKDSHTGIQARAKVALKQIELKDLSESKRVDYLDNSLKDKQIEVRDWAMRTLISQVEKEEVKKKLIKIAKDESKPISKNIKVQLMIKGIKVE